MTKYGAIADSLEFQETDKPQITNKQVLIKSHAASINPIDYKILKGDLKAMMKQSFPSPTGRDISGVVEAIGADVTDFKIGDKVFSRVGESEVGTLAQYVKADATHVSLMPQNMSFNQAASVPLVGLTAFQSLVNIAQLKQGEKVLIHAGSGGVGTFAIQLAKKLGAYVATTTSTNNVALVKSLGADQVIDYKTQNYLDEVKDFDVVYDTLGGDYTLDAFKVIKNGGRVVSVSGVVDETTAKQLGLNFFIRFILSLQARKVVKMAKQKSALYRMMLMSSNGEELTKIGDMLKNEDIIPVIDKTYKFADSKVAFEHLATGRVKGKLVIEFDV